MEAKKRILITIILGAVLIIGFYLITGAITKHTGFFVSEDVKNRETDFSVCLKEQNINLYLNTDNIAKTLEKIELADFLENIDIINCLRDNQRCLDNEVSSFPTWIINNNKVNKDINLNELSEYSGCKLIGH